MFLFGLLANGPFGDGQAARATDRRGSPGVRAFSVEEGSTPLKGSVFSLPPDELARLSFLAKVFGASVGRVTVDVGGITQNCVGYFGPDGVEWPEALEAQLVVDVLAEFGRKGPQDVQARLPQMAARAWSREIARTPRIVTRPPPPRLDTQDVVSRRRSHDGYFLMDEVTLSRPRFDGGARDLLTREVFVSYDAALVLPYDPEADTVCLVEQFRMGFFGRGDPSPWSLEPVAGHIDPGETPEQAARREAEEEAGLSLHALHSLPSFYPDPGYNAGYFHCFIAETSLGGPRDWLGGLAGEAEDIRVHVIARDRAWSMVEQGEIVVGPLILMLMWLDRIYPR